MIHTQIPAVLPSGCDSVLAGVCSDARSGHYRVFVMWNRFYYWVANAIADLNGGALEGCYYTSR